MDKPIHTAPSNLRNAIPFMRTMGTRSAATDGPVAGADHRPALLGWILLPAMLCVDGALIALSASLSGPSLRKTWHVAVEGSVSEMWQHAKWAALLVLLCILAMRYRSRLYLAWLPLLAYFLIDDSQAIHELGGGYIARQFGLRPSLGLRAQDFGELLVTAIAAIPLIGLLIFAYVTSSSEQPRAFTRQQGLLVVALGIFGVGVDMLDIIVAWPTAKWFLVLLKDGGEMVVASAMVAYAVATAVRTGDKREECEGRKRS